MDKPLILLVDDEPHITRVVASRLEKAGFTTIEQHDGATGYDAAVEHLPAMIFVDLQMPYMNGIEMATKLRANDQTANIPIVMLTARGYMVDQPQLGATNIQRLLAKPFSARELVECARDLLGDPIEQRDAA